MARNFDSGVVYSRRSRLDLVDIEQGLRTWGEAGREIPKPIQDCCARLPGIRIWGMPVITSHLVCAGLRRRNTSSSTGLSLKESSFPVSCIAVCCPTAILCRTEAPNAPSPPSRWPSHSCWGVLRRQSRHAVVLYCVLQCGQRPAVSKVSNCWWQLAHPQYWPMGGAMPQLGHLSPMRRGSLFQASASALRGLEGGPAVAAGVEGDEAKPPVLPVDPPARETLRRRISQSPLPIIRLLPRLIKNQSRLRRIWPPSSG